MNVSIDKDEIRRIMEYEEFFKMLKEDPKIKPEKKEIMREITKVFCRHGITIHELVNISEKTELLSGPPSPEKAVLAMVSAGKSLVESVEIEKEILQIYIKKFNGTED